MNEAVKREKRYWVQVEDVVKFLNEVLDLSPRAIAEIFSNRVPCSQELADHPSVQVEKFGDGPFRVGPLGILNGLFGTDSRGWGAIAGIVTKDVLAGFVLTKEWVDEPETEFEDIRVSTEEGCAIVDALSTLIENGYPDEGAREDGEQMEVEKLSELKARIADHMRVG